MFSSDEIERRLVEDGLTSLVTEGTTLGLSSVRLERSIQNTATPRAASYRVWEGKAGEGESPQVAFRHAVLIELLATLPSFGLDTMWSVVEKELAKHEETFRTGTEEEKEAAMWICLAAALGTNQSLTSEPKWQLYLAVAASIATQPDADPELQAALRKGRARSLEDYTAFFEMIAEGFGLTMKESMTFKDFTACTMALNEGLARWDDGLSINAQQQRFAAALRGLTREYFDFA